MKTIFCAVLGFVLAVPMAQALDKQITVTGQCQKAVTPDRASVVVTSEFLDKDLKTAIRLATQQYEKVRAAVKALGLPDMELTTSQYDVREDFSWEKNSRVSKGFRAQMGLEVQTSAIDRMGEVMAIAAKEGVKNVGGMTTFLAPKSMQREHFACLDEAAKDAQAKAEKLAGAVGARVGGLVSMTESSSGFSPRPPMANFKAMRAEMAMDAGGIGVEAGKQDVSVTVTASFGLR